MGTFTQLVEKILDQTIKEVVGVEELTKLALFNSDHFIVLNDNLAAIAKPSSKNAIIKYSYYFSQKFVYIASADYYTRRIKLIYTKSDVQPLRFQYNIISGIIKYATKNNFKILEVQTTGKPSELNYNTSFFDVPVYLGGIPTLSSQIKILELLEEHGMSISLDDVFTTKGGIEFWAKFGKPLKYEFKIFGKEGIETMKKMNMLVSKMHWFKPII